MSNTGYFIFMVVFFVIAIPAFIFGIWCARRQQAMQERYRGFFTRMQSFLFTDLLLAALCSVLVGIASIFVMGSTSAMYFILGPLVALIPLSIYRKLEARYGRMAARELARAMWIIENGKAMKFALRFVSVMTFEMLPKTCIATTDGIACVVRCGENSYIDADGNLYSREDLI